MNLLDGEQVLHRTEAGELTLTTHRVRCGTADSALTSIMLEQVCSIQVVRVAHARIALVGWLLLLLGLACAIWIGVKSLSLESPELYRNLERSAWVTALGTLVVAGVFFLIYYLTQYRVLTISSGGASIAWKIRWATADAVDRFIDQMEAAKARRWANAREQSDCQSV